MTLNYQEWNNGNSWNSHQTTEYKNTKRIQQKIRNSTISSRVYVYWGRTQDVKVTAPLSPESPESWRVRRMSRGILYSHSSRFREDVGVNVHHQVPTCRILHHKAHMLFCLETRKKVHQKGVPDAIHSLKNSFFTHQAVKRKNYQDLKQNFKLLWI